MADRRRLGPLRGQQPQLPRRRHDDRLRPRRRRPVVLPGRGHVALRQRQARADRRRHGARELELGHRRGPRARRLERHRALRARRGADRGARGRPAPATRASPTCSRRPGVDLSPAGPYLTNLAKGRPVSASFTTTSPALQATAPEHAVDGFTISGLPVQVGSYVARNPIWGTQGSPNAQDWLEVDLGSVRPVDTVKLYFYSNKAFGVRRQHVPRAVRLHHPVPRRLELGRRARPGAQPGGAGGQLQPGRLPGRDDAAAARAGRPAPGRSASGSRSCRCSTAAR